MVFPTFFNLSLSFPTRSSWSQLQVLPHSCQRSWSSTVLWRPTRPSRTNTHTHTHTKDILFIIGNWNAKVASQEIPGVTGNFGLGVTYEAGQRLTEFCQENTVVTANTLFQQHKRWTPHMDITRCSILRSSIDTNYEKKPARNSASEKYNGWNEKFTRGIQWKIWADGRQNQQIWLKRSSWRSMINWRAEIKRMQKGELSLKDL